MNGDAFDLGRTVRQMPLTPEEADIIRARRKRLLKGADMSYKMRPSSINAISPTSLGFRQFNGYFPYELEIDPDARIVAIEDLKGDVEWTHNDSPPLGDGRSYLTFRVDFEPQNLLHRFLRYNLISEPAASGIQVEEQEDLKADIQNEHRFCAVVMEMDGIIITGWFRQTEGKLNGNGDLTVVGEVWETMFSIVD